VIIGATIIHEIAGPLLATLSLKLSGETKPEKPKIMVNRLRQPAGN
jgi:hypothetical protein